MKRLLISTGTIIVCMLLAVNINAQNRPIDSSFLVCEYKTTFYTDTVLCKKKWNRREEAFILLVGHQMLKYYSAETDAYEKMMSDPEANAVYTKQLELAIAQAKQSDGYVKGRILARRNPLVIYTYLQANKRIVQDAVFLDYYVYEEDSAPQEWTLVSDSTKQILGYICQKALCTYRGRNYEAWFSPKLAVNAGPWKFLGLPGLIMAVKDTKGHYAFEITGIEKVKQALKYEKYKRYQYIKTDRITVLRAQAQAANIGWERYMKASTNQSATNGDNTKFMNNKSRYNLQERDYYKKASKHK